MSGTKRCSCGHEIDGSADPCPYCGKRYTTRAVWMAILIVAVFVIVWIVEALRR